jgi:hypothetical protein
MKNTSDFQAFLSILEEYNGNVWSDDFLEKLLPLDCEDYRLHFFKSKYYRSKNNVSKAVDEMHRSTTLFEQVDMYMNGILPFENAHTLVINGQMQNYDINVLGKDLYFCAGELFAEANLMEESLKAYKCFHLQNRVKSHHVPILYSFRTFNEYSLSDLANKEITLVHPSEFNDPFDTLILHWTKRFDEHCTEKQHIEPYRSSFDYYRVRSFVKDVSNTKAYENILMWSHYANGHKGYCVKYKFDEDFDSKSGLNMRFQPVVYAKRGEKIDIDDKKIEIDLGYCTKQYLWEYENEVRLIAYMPEVQSHFSPIPLGDSCRIDAIYFGVKCNDNNIRTIKNILKDTDISFYRMDYNINDVYNLKAIPAIF